MKNLIILFLFIANLISAQTLLKGRVLNAADNSPLNYSHITIENTNISCWTDNNGFFSLSGEINKTDYLIVSHIGFESKKVVVDYFINSSSKDVLLENNNITSQTILVRGSIAKEGVTPMSFSKIDQSTIKKTYSTQDIPEILSYQPSVTFYSENGNGIGYNYLSIRGFDQRRISVAVNGVPQNDPEDHNVYWIDFPDLLESSDLIQIQRGAGSGMIGYPAIGGSINIITSSFSDKPRVDFSASLGAYNTRKYSASVSSGLIENKYSIYAKFSDLLSSGYRNSSWTNLKSYHFNVARYDDNLTTQINVYSGPISDGLAYTGLPKFAIKDKNMRKANYSDWGQDNEQYTYTVERRPEEIENFTQTHYEILNDLKLNDKISINSTIFFVRGDGFFDYDASWADTSYLRLTHEFGFHPTRNPSNALIHAMVENRDFGWIPSFSYKHEDGELILGGELRMTKSLHWGGLTYAEDLPKDYYNGYRYYSFNGANNIFSFYAHEDLNLTSKIKLLAEAQLAYHQYRIFNEKYIDNDFKISNLFFNPRLGINFSFSPGLSFYVSLARVSREPRLNNYYDAGESSGGSVPQFQIKQNGQYDFSQSLVKPETMNDIEVGSTIIKDNVTASFNIYYMSFNNEIVSQGQVDRFGQPITGNIERTTHYGIEGSVTSKINKYLDITLNGTVSKNYAAKGMSYQNYTDPVTGNDNVTAIDMEGNSISGSPDFNFNGIVKLNLDNFFAQINLKYVGSFYTDNFGDKLQNYINLYPGIVDYPDNKVDSYFVANAYVSYILETNIYPKEIKLFLQVNNIFDNLYAAYGIGKEFFPAAERNLLFGIKLGM
jgi:iron complex outermembrane recepter protein